MSQQKIDIEIGQQGDYKVIKPTGDLDVYTVGSLRDAIGQMIEDSSTKVVVDLDSVPFMDSSGLGALMGGVRRLRGRIEFGRVAARCLPGLAAYTRSSAASAMGGTISPRRCGTWRRR